VGAIAKSALRVSDYGDPKCVCDAYYGGLTVEAGRGTPACMKWHENNPEAHPAKVILDRHNDGVGPVYAAERMRGSSNTRELQVKAQLKSGWVMGGLPPDPSMKDPETGERDSYQIICMPTDTNLKVGAPEEFMEGWPGGCPADMDRCKMAEPRDSYKTESEYHYEKGDYEYHCACDNYRNGASPAANGDYQELCIRFYEPGEHELFPERERGDRLVYNEIRGRREQSIKSRGPGYFGECTPRSPGYDAQFGEGFQNYGCDHPAIPCYEDARSRD